jgi:FMN phosphatase YigB (HAD superfamily)
MKKANNIKLISIDLLRTIVDIDQTPEMIWQLFLKENFPDELSRKYYRIADEIMGRRWDAAGTDDKHFKTVRTVLEDTVTELFCEINLAYDPKLAASALIADHNLQKVFKDAKPFLRKAGQKYPICLSTDCDIEMIENVDKIYPFDHIFISETLQMYKLNPKFFRYIIKHYKVPAKRILHIGDAKADIVTPKQFGIVTCWLNRRNLKWDQAIKPDFEVKSLLEILDILD